MGSDIIFGKGICKIGNILDVAVDLDIINKAGAWFSYNGEKISQGRDNAKVYLEEHPEVMKEVEEKVRKNFDQAFQNALVEDKPKDDEDENEEDDIDEVEVADKKSTKSKK